MAGRCCPFEAFEDARQLILRDPRPLVPHRDDRRFAVARDRNTDRLPARVLDRVGDEIHHDLLNAKTVPSAGDRGRGRHRKLAGGIAGRFAQALDDFAHGLGQIAGLQIECQMSARDARHVEQRFDQLRQAIADPGRPIDLLHELLVGRRCPVTRALEFQLQGGEGGLELVRSDREKFIPQSDGFLRLRQPHALLFHLSRLGQITRRLDESDQPARGVTHRRDHDACPKPRTVLAGPPRLRGELSFFGGGFELLRRPPAGDVLGGEESREVDAQDFVLAVAGDAGGAGVPACHAPLRIEHEDRVIGDVGDHQSQLLLALFQRLFRASLLGDVPKDEHGPARGAARIADGCAAVRDRPFAAVTRDERGVIGEPDDHALGQHAADRVGCLRAGVLVDDVEHLLDRAANRFLLRPPGQPLGDGVDSGDPGALVGGQHRVADAVERGGEALLALSNCFLRVPVVGHVPEHQHRAAGHASPVSDRRAAVRDRPFGAVARDERGVIGEPDDHALGQHAADRVGCLRAGVLVDDVEDLLDRAANRLLLRPPGQPLGDGIDSRDPPVFVGGEHGIADAVKGRRQILFTTSLLLFGVLAIGQVSGDLAEPSQLAVRIAKRRDHHVRPEAAAVLAHSPAFILDAALRQSGLQQRRRSVAGEVLGRVEDRDRLPDHFVREVTLDLLGAGIPRDDVASGVEHEDRIILDARDEEPELLLLDSRAVV